MPIADAWLPYSPKDTYLRAFIVGLTNTLRVAVIGIVLATVLGTLVGIARLSTNWLLSRLAAVYVEVLRDIPLLLQLLFWYVLMQGLPAARQAWKPVEGVFLSNRGLVLPSVPFEPANLWVLLAAAIGVAVTWYVHKRLTALQIEDGKVRHSWPWALLLMIGMPAALSLALGARWGIIFPELRGFNFVGGLTLAPEYFALLIALVTYTSAFIAEIVRSGIQAVPTGPMGRRQGAGPAQELRPAADRAAAGAARDHPADDQPVSQPHEELLACGRGRLPGHRLDRQHDAEPDRAGDRGRSR